MSGAPEVKITKEMSLVDNLVTVILESNPTRFLKAHHVAVDGTEQSLISFEFDAIAFGIAFDAEYGDALRVMGAELPKGK